MDRENIAPEIPGAAIANSLKSIVAATKALHEATGDTFYVTVGTSRAAYAVAVDVLGWETIATPYIGVPERGFRTAKTEAPNWGWSVEVYGPDFDTATGKDIPRPVVAQPVADIDAVEV